MNFERNYWVRNYQQKQPIVGHKFYFINVHNHGYIPQCTLIDIRGHRENLQVQDIDKVKLMVHYWLFLLIITNPIVSFKIHKQVCAHICRTYTNQHGRLRTGCSVGFFSLTSAGQLGTYEIVYHIFYYPLSAQCSCNNCTLHIHDQQACFQTWCLYTYIQSSKSIWQQKGICVSVEMWDIDITLSMVYTLLTYFAPQTQLQGQFHMTHGLRM